MLLHALDQTASFLQR